MPPLFFSPILKRIRWGGRRLGTLLGKPLGAASDYAESWELVDHGADQSTVLDGPFAGWTLQRLVQERGPELLGRHALLKEFPLLVKFLDANDRLSLQVHPNDATAKTYDLKENGKTEAWVIVHAEPGSQLFAGLKPGVDRGVLSRHLEAGTLETCLHQIPVQAGDCAFIPAGTVHAIGEGIVLAEIQQSSDLTFRLHDWGRLEADGTPRPLHLEQALACIDFDRGPVDLVKPKLVEGKDSRAEELVRCDYFVIQRHQATHDFELSLDDRFHVLMLLAGDAEITAEGNTFPFCLGQTVLIPAACPQVQITPQGETPCRLLDAFLP